MATHVKSNYSKVALFCNARDELNIKEWATHHLLLGFDSIIIFDHKSEIPLKNVFSNFNKRVFVIRTELPDGCIKMKLMNLAKCIAKKCKIDWFIYMDADEFLILNKYNNIREFISSYSFADSIGINWLFFGTNHFTKDPPGLTLENFTKSSKMLCNHVKTFVRTNKVINADNPHFYHMKNKKKMVGIDGKRITTYPAIHEYIVPFEEAPLYIAHHVYQSEQTYLRRKIRLMADDGSIRTDQGKEIHNVFNDVDNTQALKYIKRIKKCLHYYNK
jgi:hypothetical protein